MGMWTSVGDVLTAYSGVAIPHEATKPRVGDAQIIYPKFVLNDAAERAIKEFTLGMQLLQHYIDRTSVDMETIAADNLRLLHTNLKRVSNYKRLLALPKLTHGKAGDWHWTQLIGSKDITAGLLFMEKSCSIYPAHYPTQANIFTNHLYTKDLNGSNNDCHYRLLLTLHGNLSIKSVVETTDIYQQFETLMPSQTKQEVLMAKLEHGDAFVEKQRHTHINSLQTNKEACLVLCVNLAAPEPTNRH